MWRMSGLVEKTALRPEVREFCDQYPVYRLSDYPLERNAEGLAGWLSSDRSLLDIRIP